LRSTTVSAPNAALDQDTPDNVYFDGHPLAAAAKPAEFHAARREIRLNL